MSVWSSVPGSHSPGMYVYEYEYKHGFADEDEVLDLSYNEDSHVFLDVATTWGPLIRLCVEDSTYTLDVRNAKLLRDGLTHAIDHVEDLPKLSRITSEDE